MIVEILCNLFLVYVEREKEKREQERIKEKREQERMKEKRAQDRMKREQESTKEIKYKG